MFSLGKQSAIQTKLQCFKYQAGTQTHPHNTHLSVQPFRTARTVGDNVLRVSVDPWHTARPQLCTFPPLQLAPSLSAGAKQREDPNNGSL